MSPRTLSRLERDIGPRPQMTLVIQDQRICEIWVNGRAPVITLRDYDWGEADPDPAFAAMLPSEYGRAPEAIARYSYVLNNPGTSVDPEGLSILSKALGKMGKGLRAAKKGIGKGIGKAGKGLSVAGKSLKKFGGGFARSAKKAVGRVLGQGGAGGETDSTFEGPTEILRDFQMSPVTNAENMSVLFLQQVDTRLGLRESLASVDSNVRMQPFSVDRMNRVNSEIGRMVDEGFISLDGSRGANNPRPVSAAQPPPVPRTFIPYRPPNPIRPIQGSSLQNPRNN